jgi:hypothetical protein
VPSVIHMECLMNNHKHSPAANRIAQRQLVRSVACPKCGAISSQKCIGVRVKKRAASHIERWGAYKQKLKEQS